MPTVLVFASPAVLEQIEASPVWRGDLERLVVKTSTEAVSRAASVRPNLLVDSELPAAEHVVRQLRANADTRGCSIAAVAGDDLMGGLGMLDAGANAVLRLPPGPEWDERLQSLLEVPTRKETRIEASLTLSGELGEQKIRARVTNISVTGMLMETAMAIAVGSEFRFRLELLGFETSSGEVSGSGRVVRLAGAGRYGAQFLKLEPVGRELLRRFITLA